MIADDVVAVLKGKRLPLHNEKELQAEIAAQFELAGLGLRREYRLGQHDIADFFGDGLAVEVKIKGGRRNIFRQLERYAGHSQVERLLLVTNVPMGLPPSILDKPINVFNLARAWL